MAILYADFTASSTNYGNYVIEHATQQFLSNYFANKQKNVELIRFDSFKKDIPDGQYEALFIPGCTMITPGQNRSLDLVYKLPYKSFCLAGSLWYPNKSKSFLIKSRVLTFGKSSGPDLSIVNNLSGIIGSRDRFTYNTLLERGLNTLYVGCPTLFLDSSNVSENDYVLFSFGRHNYHKQVYYASKIAKNHNVIGITHEVGDIERARAAGWKFPIVGLYNDIELYLSYFKNAKYVISGRLHGVLPALAYNKRSLYFGTDDTRTSILHDLGITINDYNEIPNFESKSNIINNKSVLEYFKSNMTKVADSIFA